ncbi:MAG: hypothetical protein J5787_01245 [Alphaproteobacteria bacterium]|nr:hypothetical protein [Alphaproteobacteria bacterium]
MKKRYLVGLLFLSGCAFTPTTFKCIDDPCPSYYKSSNQCLAQANASCSADKDIIWEQCMAGLGYMKQECNPQQKNENPCQPFHIY